MEMIAPGMPALVWARPPMKFAAAVWMSSLIELRCETNSFIPVADVSDWSSSGMIRDNTTTWKAAYVDCFSLLDSKNGRKALYLTPPDMAIFLWFVTLL